VLSHTPQLYKTSQKNINVHQVSDTSLPNDFCEALLKLLFSIKDLYLILV